MEKVMHNENEYNVIQSYVDGWFGWRCYSSTFIEFHRLVGNHRNSFYVAVGDLQKILEEVKKNEEPLPF